TGITSLCMAGGVAHNSTLNGKILYSGLFGDVFVQPASCDSGCAIGAALSVFMQAKPREPRPPARRIEHVFWGRDLGGDAEIGAALDRWGDCLSVEHVPDIAQCCANLLATGEVIGWAQGRSEFGPRAL